IKTWRSCPPLSPDIPRARQKRRPVPWRKPEHRLKWVTFHSFRHTWATWMRRYAKATIDDLVDSNNWKDRRSAARYVHAAAEGGRSKQACRARLAGTRAGRADRSLSCEGRSLASGGRITRSSLGAVGGITSMGCLSYSVIGAPDTPS